MNIPSLITWFRVLVIPIFVLLFYLPIPGQHIVLTVLFAVASFTDWLDGYLARRWNQTSSFGAFLDPVADKLIVAAALILLAVADPNRWYLTIAVIIIISREITISALREWMATMGERGVVAVSWIGKWKTAFQMVAIAALLYRYDFMGLPIYKIGLGLLLIATFLTLWSMVQYLYATWKVLRVSKKSAKKDYEDSE